MPVLGGCLPLISLELALKALDQSNCEECEEVCRAQTDRQRSPMATQRHLNLIFLNLPAAAKSHPQLAHRLLSWGGVTKTQLVGRKKLGTNSEFQLRSSIHKLRLVRLVVVTPPQESRR